MTSTYTPDLAICDEAIDHINRRLYKANEKFWYSGQSDKVRSYIPYVDPAKSINWDILCQNKMAATIIQWKENHSSLKEILAAKEEFYMEEFIPELAIGDQFEMRELEIKRFQPNPA